MKRRAMTRNRIDAQVRIHARYVRLLHSARQRFQPTFRPPFVGVRSPERWVDIGGANVRKYSCSLRDGDRVRERSVLEADRLR